MSGNLIGGVVGASIGFLVGGPAGAAYGFSIGSAAGGLLLPGQLPGVEGPRLTDLRVQSSEYGRPIPIVYGTVGIAGNVIWASDIVEVKTDTTTGGKGGPSQTTSNYSYYGNFAVAVCDGPVAGIGRIWAGPEKRLVWDGQKLEGGGEIRVYLGTEDQEPDPLIEVYLGAGNVPAYRGTCYVVFENFPLANDGNRLPFLTFEVGSTNKATLRLGDVVWFDRVFRSAAGGADGAGSFVSAYHGSTNGVIRNAEGTLLPIVNMPTGSWAPDFHYIWDESRERLVTVPNNLQPYFDDQILVTDIIGGTYNSYKPMVVATGDIGFDAVYAGGMYVLGFNRSGGGARFAYIDPDGLAFAGDQVVDAGNTNTFSHMYAASPGANFFWAVRTNGEVARIDVGATASVHIGTAPSGFDAPGNSNYSGSRGAYNIYDGNLWLCSLLTSGGAVNYASYTSSATRFSATSAPSNFFGLAAQPWTFSPDPGDGTIGVYLVGERWLGLDEYMRFAPDNSSAPVEYTGVYHGVSSLQAVMWDESSGKTIAIRYGGFYAGSEGGTPITLRFNDGNLSDDGGVATLSAALLGNIVADLSSRAGMNSYDVSALTDTVDGYVVAKQTDVRSAIDALRPAYYFDAVESQGIVRFVKRGGAVSATVADEDLAASPAGTQADDPLATVRKQEVELPRTINVNYMLAATDYEAATKTAKRLVGYSRDESTLEMPLVITDAKAQQIAEVNLHAAWAGRVSYSFTLPRKYSRLEPTDLIVVQGHLMRLTKVTATPAGVLKCEAMSDDASYYAPHVVVTETPPVVKTVFVPGSTTLELM
jgi:hypothetical protein